MPTLPSLGVHFLLGLLVVLHRRAPPASKHVCLFQNVPNTTPVQVFIFQFLRRNRQKIGLGDEERGGDNFETEKNNNRGPEKREEKEETGEEQAG